MISGVNNKNHGGETTVRGGRGGGGGFALSSVEIVTWLWIISALATIAVSEMHQRGFYTQGRYGKRGESFGPAVMPFFSGSRYGRSGTTNARGPKSAVPKLLEVSPRVDRFFLGSRYGKRAPITNNNNNNSNNLEQQQMEASSRLSSLRRFQEAALGYLDRIQRADNLIRLNDNVYDENTNKDTNNDKRNGEDVPIDIPNNDELEKFW